MSDAVPFYSPGTPEYDRVTSPHNSSGSQKPAFVAIAATSAEASAIVIEARSRGLRVIPQSTGHGAGGEIAGDSVILDTSALKTLSIDPDARTASAGAGLTWGEVNGEGERHGLLGLAGSSPTVGICGYTFGGGLGWLARPNGLASSALRSVEYVDGTGTIRIAAEDSPHEVDRNALWAFRGGGGVGVATRLDFDLVPINDLHAGFLLWTIDALPAVVAAWASTIDSVGDAVGTSISVLHAPPAPPFPDDLRGQPIVHLAIASNSGEAGAAQLLEAVRAAATPALDTWGPADVAKLSGIHLDPPFAVPAIGDAHWLTDATPASAAAILGITADAHSPLALIEIRSVGNDSVARDGALTKTPGSFVVHAVGALIHASMKPAIDAKLAEIRAVVEPVSASLRVGSWVEGAVSVPDALPADIRARVARIADEVDPDGSIARSRYLA